MSILPNLDSMNLRELEDLGHIMAILLTFEEEPETLFRVVYRFKQYIEEKQAAMIARNGYCEESALRHEGRCKSIYATLPAWARW